MTSNIDTRPRLPGSSVFLLLLLFSLVIPATARDTVPVLPEPVLPELEMLARSGNTDAVERWIANRREEGMDDAALDLMLVRLALHAGNAERAEDLLQALPGKHAFLKKFVQKELIALHIKNGNLEDALKIHGVFSGSRLSTDEARLLAEIGDKARETRHFKLAEKLYLRALKVVRKGGTADRCRLGLSISRVETNQLELALKNLRYLQLHFQEPEIFRQARDLEISIHAPAGRARPAFSEREYRTMSERLISRAAYTLALELLSEWQQRYPESSSQDRISFLRLSILRHEREDEAAYKAGTDFLQTFKKSKLGSSVRLQQLVLLQRLGSTDELRRQALAIWNGETGDSKRERRNAAMLLAAYLVSSGHAEEGLLLYRDIYRSGISRGLQNEILWRVGVGCLRDNQNERALDNLRVLLKRRPEGVELLSTLYWLAEAEQRNGNPQNAVTNLLQILGREPFTYYGFLAQTRLTALIPSVDFDWFAKERRKFIKPAEKFEPLELSRQAAESAEYKALVSLARAGYEEQLAEAADDFRSKFRRDKAAVLLSAQAYSRGGEIWRSVSTAHTWFKKELETRLDDTPAEIVRLAYPRPFNDEIKKAAFEQRLDPLFMTSIMRQESRFDPEATSWVGARGLFQFMPYTAEILGPQLGYSNIQPDDLYEPRVNARLAAYYQRNLFDIFNNRIPPIIASYNAGESRALAWWKAALAEKIPEDLFIDTIPYRETRTFVRAVLTNYFVYMRLYSSSN